jgi:hypothetical protein
MGSTTRSALLELLDAFWGEGFATESGESPISRRNLALEKDATWPYAVIRASDSQKLAMMVQDSSQSRKAVRAEQYDVEARCVFLTGN